MLIEEMCKEVTENMHTLHGIGVCVMLISQKQDSNVKQKRKKRKNNVNSNYG